MDISIKHTTPASQRSACLIVGVFERRRLSEAAKALDEASGARLSKVLRQGDFDGKLGQTLVLHRLEGLACERVMLVGCGKERDFEAAPYRKAVGAAVKALGETGATEAVCYLADLPVKDCDAYWRMRHASEAAQHAVYRFDQLKSKKDDDKKPLRRLVFDRAQRRESAKYRQGVDDGQAVAAGVALARDLGNLPGNVCTPAYLADQARKLGRGHKNVKVTVLEQRDMEKLGMGALLSVARGSRQPPKLISVEYSGGKKGDKPFVLVGKGVTFDAGGISIKPAQAMDEMKFDMCGAASVLGTLHAVIALGLPINVVGVVPSSENLPDGDANKPGDIVTSLSGQTVEVLNTDAEGRLLLCDALTYAERFEPKTVIDIATLTGACVVALGKHASGLFTNHAPLAKELLEAGTRSGDRAWELPLWEDYQDQLKSNFADMANIGGPQAGAVTAACFLSRFTKGMKWAHLDIAGAAWDQGANKGATGRPVTLLTQYLLRHAGRR